jgi:dimethyladenosine transferase 1
MTLFQDRYATDRDEPEVDQSQDYEMLLGYENGTHTVIRFRRKYDTCDQHDYRITVGR